MLSFYGNIYFLHCTIYFEIKQGEMSKIQSIIKAVSRKVVIELGHHFPIFFHFPSRKITLNRRSENINYNNYHLKGKIEILCVIKTLPLLSGILCVWSLPVIISNYF